MEVSEPEIKGPVDQDVVRIVQSMRMPPISAIAPEYVGIEESALSTVLLSDLLGGPSSDEDFALPHEREIEVQDLTDDQPRPAIRSAEPFDPLLGKEAEILTFHGFAPADVCFQAIVRSTGNLCTKSFSGVMSRKEFRCAFVKACFVSRMTSNNCHVNAFIQVMYHMLPLRRLTLHWPSSESVTLQLHRIFANMVGQRLISPVFISDLCERRVRGPKDSAEFAMKLLDPIDELLPVN
jgi:hypothetical protein